MTIASGANSVRASAVGTTVSKVVFFGSYNGGIVGGGAAFIDGDLRPGNSPGVVSFGGDLVLDGLSRLFIDIGGTTPGNGPGNHDQVNVVGNASLGGQLILSPFNGFVPASGDKFVIITDGSETGTFTSVSGTSPAAGLTYTPVYLSNSVVVLTTTNGEKTWGVDSDGNASVGSNWIGGVVPGGIGDTATFSTIITAPRVVTLDADTTLGTVKFDSPISYTIAGPHTLTLQATGSAAATISDSNDFGNGAHTISAPLTLLSALNIVQNSNGPFTLSGAERRCRKEYLRYRLRDRAIRSEQRFSNNRHRRPSRRQRLGDSRIGRRGLSAFVRRSALISSTPARPPPGCSFRERISRSAKSMVLAQRKSTPAAI